MRIIGSGCTAVRLPLEDNLLLQRELGFRETDLLLVSGWAHVGTDELEKDYGGVCKRIERALSRADMRPAAVNVKYSEPLEAVDEAADRRRREADAVIRFMREFGVERISIQPTLSMDKGVLAAGKEAAVRETMALRERYAEQGMKLSLEPHTMSSFCFSNVLRAVRAEHPDFPVTFDPSHLLCEGESMRETLWLTRGTTMVHLRDADKGRLFVPYGEGCLDLSACVTALAVSGYDGPIAVETIFDECPTEAEKEKLFEFVRDMEACLSRI